MIIIFKTEIGSIFTIDTDLLTFEKSGQHKAHGKLCHVPEIAIGKNPCLWLRDVGGIGYPMTLSKVVEVERLDRVRPDSVKSA